MIRATIFSDSESVYNCTLPCWIVNGAQEIKEVEKKKLDLLQKEQDWIMLMETTKKKTERVEKLVNLLLDHYGISIPEEEEN